MPALQDIEIDVIELSSGCAEACSHCSESPEQRLVHASPDLLLESVRQLVKIEEEKGISLFANYWFPFPASDPFAFPGLARLCHGLWQTRGIRSYMLSLGWNQGIGAPEVERLVAAPSCLVRLGITVSNFSRLAEVNYVQHTVRLGRCLKDLEPLWEAQAFDGRPLLFLSPQFVQGAPKDSPYSFEAVERLLSEIEQLSGLPVEQWRNEGRIHSRPVTGLGRAMTVLGVSTTQQLPITAEDPALEISRFPERGFSGLLTMQGTLQVVRAQRGVLGRRRATWEPFDLPDLPRAPARAATETAAALLPVLTG